MKVKNLNGTSGMTCPCKTWLDHWKNFTGRNVQKCMVIGCSAQAAVGGHVKKVDSTDNKHYIVPLCYGCNSRTDNFDVAAADLVSANKSETCKK